MALRELLRASVIIAVATALFATGTGRAEAPVSVTALDVNITSGSVALPAGVALELKIYEQGPVPRIVALPPGDAWPAAATRLVRVKLDRPLDPRRVRRFSIAYPAQSAQQAPWEIASAVVEWEAGGRHERLLAATLSGVLARDRDVASEEVVAAQLVCARDADCDDGKTCNGVERCEPQSRFADARGCVVGRPVVCPVNQVCVEHVGCRGAPEAATGR